MPFRSHPSSAPSVSLAQRQPSGCFRCAATTATSNANRQRFDLQWRRDHSLGAHSSRRANITRRQEVGGAAIETSKIAGHASTPITDEYALVGIKRQDEMTRRIQDKRAKAAKKAKKAVPIRLRRRHKDRPASCRALRTLHLPLYCERSRFELSFNLPPRPL